VAAEVENEKRLAAEAAAEIVQNGMRVGLGTGSTVAYLLPALARRRLSLRCVATSPETAQVAQTLGLTIDGADQITPEGWLIKGGGAAHTREKVVAVTATQFVVIADSTKPVAALRAPVPLELLSFGLESTLRRLGTVSLRDVKRSPDGGVIADFTGEVGDPGALAAMLEATPGVVDHGLFGPELVSTIFVGRGASVQRIDLPSA